MPFSTTLLVMSGKGGVGKSTVAVNLAYGFVLRGLVTGILDADIHGPSLPRMLGMNSVRIGPDDEGKPHPVRIHDNLFAVSAGNFMTDGAEPLMFKGPMKAGIIRQLVREIVWPPLDILVVDTPPGTGDEHFSVIENIDGRKLAVVVTTPQDVAFADAKRTLRFCDKLGIPVVGLAVNMAGFVCPHCGQITDIFGGSGGEGLREDGFGDVPVLCRIPLDPDMTLTGDTGRPYLFDFAKKEGGRSIDAAVEKILALL